jgi:hypothetical protein
MAQDSLITMQCPSCGKGHPSTWDNLVTYWQVPFICEGCGTQMRVDREEALAARDRAGTDGKITVMMIS